MGKLNASIIRYLSATDFRILTAIEMGMKNHEVVPLNLVTSISQVHLDGMSKVLRELSNHGLVSYEQNKKHDGYRLTNMGYDYLAINVLVKRDTVSYFGNQIGVGKESNIYTVADAEGKELCMKLHRLGRTCFRNIKNKRDYHKHRTQASWLYLSRISATKEYEYMKALYARKFPIPQPIDCNRHCVVMELIQGQLLNIVSAVSSPGELYDELMELIVRFACAGVIHADFNEFNIILTQDEKPIIIDFPQMISILHADAEMYFDRDVQCVRTFFKKRFNYESDDYPVFEDIERSDVLDFEIRCSGADKHKAKELGIKLNSIDEEESDKLSSGSLENKVVKTKAGKVRKGKEDKRYMMERFQDCLTKEECEDTNYELEEGTKSDLLQDEASNSKDVSQSKEGLEKFTCLRPELLEDEVEALNLEEIDSLSESEGSLDDACAIASVTSTTYTNADITKRIKKQMLDKQRKAKSRQIAKKSMATIRSRMRKDVKDTINESTGIWG